MLEAKVALAETSDISQYCLQILSEKLWNFWDNSIKLDANLKRLEVKYGLKFLSVIGLIDKLNTAISHYTIFSSSHNLGRCPVLPNSSTKYQAVILAWYIILKRYEGTLDGSRLLERSAKIPSQHRAHLQDSTLPHSFSQTLREFPEGKPWWI